MSVTSKEARLKIAKLLTPNWVKASNYTCEVMLARAEEIIKTGKLPYEHYYRGTELESLNQQIDDILWSIV